MEGAAKGVKLLRLFRPREEVPAPVEADDEPDEIEAMLIERDGIVFCASLPIAKDAE